MSSQTILFKPFRTYGTRPPLFGATNILSLRDNAKPYWRNISFSYIG
jgi:hypothetical protein